MNGWQKNEEALHELRLKDTATGEPIDPGSSEATVTWTKPNKSTVDVALVESGGVWSGIVFFDADGAWVPRLTVTGAHRIKRRLATVMVGDD